MKRHFYVGSNLSELEIVARELQKSGVSAPQIHVLSENDAGVASHHLHEVDSVLKQDVVHSGEVGFLVGVTLAAAVLLVAGLVGWPETYTWVPFLLLSIVVFGFCTWEGVLIGLQKPHQDFMRFTEALHQGRRVFFVDVHREQERMLDGVMTQHPGLELAGVGESAPDWVIRLRQQWQRFIHSAP